MPENVSIGSPHVRKGKHQTYASEDDTRILNTEYNFQRLKNDYVDKSQLIKSFNPFTLSKNDSISQSIDNEYRYPFFSSSSSHEKDEDDPKRRYRLSEIKLPSPKKVDQNRDKSPVE